MTNKRISRGAEIRERQRVLERCDFSRLLLRPVAATGFSFLMLGQSICQLCTCQTLANKLASNHVFLPGDSSRALAVLRTAELPGAADS